MNKRNQILYFFCVALTVLFASPINSLAGIVGSKFLRRSIEDQLLYSIETARQFCQQSLDVAAFWISLYPLQNADYLWSMNVNEGLAFHSYISLSPLRCLGKSSFRNRYLSEKSTSVENEIQLILQKEKFCKRKDSEPRSTLKSIFCRIKVLGLMKESVALQLDYLRSKHKSTSETNGPELSKTVVPADTPSSSKATISTNGGPYDNLIRRSEEAIESIQDGIDVLYPPSNKSIWSPQLKEPSTRNFGLKSLSEIQTQYQKDYQQLFEVAEMIQRDVSYSITEFKKYYEGENMPSVALNYDMAYYIQENPIKQDDFTRDVDVREIMNISNFYKSNRKRKKTLDHSTLFGLWTNRRYIMLRMFILVERDLKYFTHAANTRSNIPRLSLFDFGLSASTKPDTKPRHKFYNEMRKQSKHFLVCLSDLISTLNVHRSFYDFESFVKKSQISLMKYATSYRLKRF